MTRTPRLTWTAACWSTATFRRQTGRALAPTEMTLIALLERRRLSPSGLRVYILDPYGDYYDLLIRYADYARSFRPGEPPAAIITRVKPRLFEHLLRSGYSPRTFDLYSSRRPDAIRGRGAYTSILVAGADLFSVTTDADPLGTRNIVSAASSIHDGRGTSLIVFGTSADRDDRTFTLMYNRIAAHSTVAAYQYGRGLPVRSRPALYGRGLPCTVAACRDRDPRLHPACRDPGP